MDRGILYKRKNSPKETAGFFSLLTFSYLLSFIRKGRKKEIEEYDLYNVMSSFQSKKLGDALEKKWNEKKKTELNSSIISSIISCYKLPAAFLAISETTVKIIQLYTMPWALSKFVLYFTKNQTEVSREMAFVYAGTMVAITLIGGTCDQHFNLYRAEISIKIKAALSSLLYRKSLKLSQFQLAEISTGKIVTSIVKDVSTIQNAISYGIEFGLGIFQVGIVCFMLYLKVGSGSIGGLSVMVFSIIIQILVSRQTYFKRGKCNEKSDQRLQQTQEVLSSIRLIKMYRWENFFKENLSKVRKSELWNLKLVFIWKSISIILGIVSSKIAQASVYGLYLYLGHDLGVDVIYYIQQLFQKVARAVIFIPLGIQAIAELIVALDRIDRILNAEENDAPDKSEASISKPEIFLHGVDVDFETVKVLKNINLELKPGLNILVGSSACGKSTLLKTILGEYKTTKGRVNVKGTVSYASQNPWLFASSVKQNILFGQKYDQKKYKEVVEMCGLTYDFNTFMNGDETILTDCGVNLSRGQQSRINLARAIYKNSDIYLLDDCLASLDIQIKKHVFYNAIKKYFGNKLCVLVTHSTEFVQQADNVIVLGDRTVTFSGKPNDVPVNIFQQTQNNQNDDVDETIEESKTTISVNEQNELNEDSTLLQKKNSTINIYKENKEKGRVNLQCYKSYFGFGGGWKMITILVGFHIVCELTSGAGEKIMSTWVNEQAAALSKFSNSAELLRNSNFTTTTWDSDNLTSTTEETVTTFTTIVDNTTFLSIEHSKMEESVISVKFYIYVGSLGIYMILVTLRCFITYYYTIKVSNNIHKSMVTNILQGTMTFFDTHLIGHILTRFSKDLFILDEIIPFIWLEGCRLFFLLPVALVLIASVSYLLAGFSICLAIIFFYICNFILSTTRSTQRLSNSTLSPVIGHLNASLDGLVTIRACGSQQILKDEFDKHQDVLISANHLREIASRVLGFYTLTLAAIFSSIVTFGLLMIDADALPGNVGLVVSQSSMLCLFLEFSLMMWMLMENCMTSVERALEYTKLPQENQKGRYIDQWPQEGGIKYQNVTLTYRTNGETVLKNLNFDIQPQEKIGIVGRTGAGKSSIIVALFKMYDFNGNILIDNVDLKTLSLDCLRTHLAIIPQEPVIFTGTLRTNINPNSELSDNEIWKILEVVNLKKCFKSLDENIARKNLSIGQKQLICLARALTRKCKIVILDEATANMDEEMDFFIQNKIRDLFQFCTVITVAHRLHTIRNCDKIMVMDKGAAVEFDTPNKLLSNPSGLFYKMVYQKKNE